MNKSVWKSAPIGKHLVSHPKSRHLSGASSENGIFNFYVCSQNVLKSTFYDRDDEAILVSTGGELAVHLTKGKYAYSSDVWAFKGSDEVKTAYIYRWIELNKTKFNYQGFQGSSIQHLDKDFFYKQEIPIPPIDEQSKICSILDSVDHMIENLHLQLDKSEQLREAFINTSIDNLTNMGTIKIIDAVDKIIDCEHKTAPIVENSKYLVIGTGDIKKGRLNIASVRGTDQDSFAIWTSRGTPEVGDVLFTREAPAGEVCPVPTNLNVCLGQRMVLLKTKKTVISGEYLAIFLQSNYAKKQIYRYSIGTTVNRINIEDIKLINILTPALGEQIKIVSSLNLMDTNIQLLVDKLNSCENLKKSLMNDLLNPKSEARLN